MAYNFLPYDEQQLYLLPASIVEWVRDDSLARFVGETVDLLDRRGQLDGFYEGYRRDGWGHPAYHPRMLVKVLVYGHSIGVTSSRKLAAACENEIALRYLTANQQPDFRTISDFRKDHLAALEELFVEVLGLCQEAGLVKLGRVALDGRKVAGNASLDQNRDEEWLRKEVAKLLAQAERVDAEEDAQYGKERRGDELPEGMRTKEERRQRLEAALERIEEKKRQAAMKQERKMEKRRREETESGKKARGRKPKGPEQAALEAAKKTKANVTDPESRIMKTRRGWVQGFNGQAAADCKSQVIVARRLAVIVGVVLPPTPRTTVHWFITLQVDIDPGNQVRHLLRHLAHNLSSMPLLVVQLLFLLPCFYLYLLSAKLGPRYRKALYRHQPRDIIFPHWFLLLISLVVNLLRAYQREVPFPPLTLPPA